MTAWLLANMAAASVMMLIVLAIRTPVARAFGAVWAYALWLLPLGRLLLPPLPQIGPELPLPTIAVWLPVAVERAAPVEAGGGLGWPAVLLAVWAAGAAIFLAVQFLAYRRFLARLSLASRSAGAFRGLPVVESEAVDGPIAVGLLDRRIVVPADFTTRYSETERRLAAEHEYVHHRRGDIWWNLAALLVLALNWFNPLAWVAFVAFRADQELACDAAVAARAAPGERADYARALVKSASRPGLIAACPLNHADQLKRRLKMMNTHRTGRLRSIGGAAALVTLAGTGLALAAPGMAHPHPDGEGKQERIVIMEHKAGEAAPDGRGNRVMRFRRGANGEPVLPENCGGGGDNLVNVDEGTGEQRTRVFLCTTGPVDAATRLQRLEEIRRNMASNDEMTGEHRERVLGAIDRAIAELRARQ
ncbi:MAG TPA: M56 family metallopeptidase [Allosphingosinicella sp.]|jgi:beta-lactamase regulating signal transducer with metallopeptidase domain